jgi:hypothetical protein
MSWVRKWLILTHRYLGIVLSLLFVMWFLSGIGMIYARGMPVLTAQTRLDRAAPLDLARVKLSPSEAAVRAGLIEPSRAVLLMLLNRPAYRFGSTRPVTIYADTGERLEAIGPGEAAVIAARFMKLREDTIRYAGVVLRGDQWTLEQRRQLPLHKIVVDDNAGTELYVSQNTGEIVMLTTRATRALAWVAAIPHWMYFAPLRLNDGAWRHTVLWTSGIGSLLALLGVALSVVQFRPARPFTLRRVSSSIPYAGLMRWHYITGAIFGILTFTWVFSGLLSMNPWGWPSDDGIGDEVREALAGGDLDLSSFPQLEPAAWDRIVTHASLRELEFTRIQGQFYCVARLASSPDLAIGSPLLVSMNPLRIRQEPFSVASLVAIVRAVHPDAPIVATDLLTAYDSYYYSRDREAPLPVVRMKFADTARTWLYLDPKFSRLVGRLNRRERLNRWIYNGFHSLDFSFWYYNRPLWDIGMIVLNLGGAAVSGLGLVLGIRRVQRAARRALGTRSTS